MEHTWQPLLDEAATNHGGRHHVKFSDENANSGSHPHLNRSESTEVEERGILQRRQEQPGWTVDRGTGFYASERARHKRAFLVETGRHAGRSRVKLAGVGWQKIIQHIVKRDFFNAAVNAKLYTILAAMFLAYFFALVLWGLMYYFTWRIFPKCFIGFHGLSSAILFSIETQQTIGYGTRCPGDCWISALLVGVHSVVSVIIDSVIIGIVFARISHPKYRGRTILMSDCATIARRDGVLKFMLRVADIKSSHIVGPTLKAVLYTWGPGRVTQEGEILPVRRQNVKFEPWDTTLLLPVIVQHIIDERSPLYGLDAKSLETLNAEIVVQLEGCTELGDMFMVRRSYLPQEIYWGHNFTTILRPPMEGETEYSVDIARFHDVEPQAGLHMDMMPVHKLSSKVVANAYKILPPENLTESSLVITDDLVVGPRDGKLYLMIRLGDRRPGQVLDIHVRAFLYRWTPVVTQEGETLPYSVDELSITPSHPILRYPLTIKHEIKSTSPIANWSKVEGKRMDADAEIVVVVKGMVYATNEPTVSTRAFPVLTSVKWGHVFAPVVFCEGPGGGKHVVDWRAFHATIPFTPAPQGGPVPTLKRAQSKQTLTRPEAVQSNRGSSSAGRQDGMPLAPGGGHGGGHGHKGDRHSTSGSKGQLLHSPSIGAGGSTRNNEQSIGMPSLGTGGSAADACAPSISMGEISPQPTLKHGDSWKNTRSLFTALEEMHSLLQQEEDEGQERDRSEIGE
eukprot:gene14778-20828_t